MRNPEVLISWGELFDKITILEIKLENLKHKAALNNVKNEYKLLYAIFEKTVVNNPQAKKLVKKLKSINQRLWEIEDKIREKEKEKVFDSEFVELARSVYLTNDKRSQIKRDINDLYGSELVEEKSYSEY